MIKLHLQSSSLYCRMKCCILLSKSETILLENWWDLLQFEIGLKQAIKLYLCKPRMLPAMYDKMECPQSNDNIPSHSDHSNSIPDTCWYVWESGSYFYTYPIFPFVKVYFCPITNEKKYILESIMMLSSKKNSLKLFMILEKIPTCTCVHLIPGLIKFQL